MNLKTETLAEIDATVPLYPVVRSAVLPVLQLVQADQGYLSDEAIRWTAERLGLQPINVYEVATFYPGLRRKPIGRRHVRVCRTLSCALVGGYKTCDVMREELGCAELGGTSEDGAFTVEFVECLASCGSGPVALVDEVLHENLNEARTRELAAQLRAEEKSAAPFAKPQA